MENGFDPVLLTKPPTMALPAVMVMFVVGFSVPAVAVVPPSAKPESSVGGISARNFVK